MDELLNMLKSQGGQGELLGTWETLMAMALALSCLAVISLAYRFTHKGPEYSQSFVQTLVLTGLVTTLIMIVIGSNIARAFSLVGALSIIRFRNAVKETRDVGFIFFAMAIAMACGTRFYSLAILATLLISAVMIVMYLLNFGSKQEPPERLLSVQLPAGIDPKGLLSPVLERLFSSHQLLSVANARQGLYTEAVVSVRPRPDTTAGSVLSEISAVNDNLKITYSYGRPTDGF